MQQIYYLYKRFYSFLAQKMLKMTISTSVAQHSNAGRNIQQRWDSYYSNLILCWTLFFLFLPKILPAQVMKRKICILWSDGQNEKYFFLDTSKSGKRHAQICFWNALLLSSDPENYIKLGSPFENTFNYSPSSDKSYHT